MATISKDFTIYLLMFRDQTLRRLDLNCAGLINSRAKSARSHITNPVKTPPVLQVSPGVLEDVEVLDEHGGGVI